MAERVEYEDGNIAWMVRGVKDLMAYIRENHFTDVTAVDVSCGGVKVFFNHAEKPVGFKLPHAEVVEIK